MKRYFPKSFPIIRDTKEIHLKFNLPSIVKLTFVYSSLTMRLPRGEHLLKSKKNE